MTMFKPCIGHPICEKLVKHLIRDFIDQSYMADAKKVYVLFRCIENQVNHALTKERMLYKRQLLPVPHEVLVFLGGK